MSSCSRLTLFGLMLPLMVAPGLLYADDGVPALLQFAEQYHRQEPQQTPEDKLPPAKTPAAKPVSKGGQTRELSVRQQQQLAAARATLRENEAQLQHQQARIQSLQQELTALRAKESNKVMSQQDLTELSKFASGLRQAFNLTPKEQQMQALIAKTQQALEQQKSEAAKVISGLQQQAKQSDEALVTANRVQKNLRDEIEGLRSQGRLLLDHQALEKDRDRQSYAAGVALGRDIQTLLTERKSWGIDPDRTALLAGVIDTFNGQYQLSEKLLASALTESEQAVNVARNQVLMDQRAKGESFVAEFKKKKGAKKSSSGFWYRIDYPGDGAIAETSRVDVVVKETLTDGLVIQDMESSGKVLSQSLSAFPPLFREAIGYLKNHGSLTMVVPPELAYGEAGYAPQIPPDATMVYELRIVDVDK
ncbi:FKBP-type peptidyl-prolyl cis-trans isomerase N-terminal domain-containing protein [Serratia quinivorans]|uniref:FKBP-type peptidyl-prolyl cis-trans isomerase N-terminal domain-containing protein n=1 Tax=Serratia quinivorans TaxID=137545 RepID=UPI00217B38D7|nr:FKBP-type peptidyl-prolyl cis-trans isomerase N-terminal domain-containing protein [Serratia quinivorans]CAI0891781.1 FKBP-type peptidyl-prolyl cis-trans isomerase fkpA precursor [Serratia quinivorans]CAI1555094.1 FKBP-type peptidyl-prolyl cis-trans isomerase fkpA precursor [Serratia quinivorans]